jgi:tetratricopeptide (TPR) repeat protein
MLPPKVTNSAYAEEQLRKAVENDPDDWNSRKIFSRFLYDRGDTREAAELIWKAPEIPSVDFEIAYAARILAKGTPRRAIRLLNAVLEQNKGRPAQNLGLANALLHHGMVMQAARFYGAAIEGDDKGDMASADLEHFLLWIDDREKLWGDFEGVKDQLDELPWMMRNPRQAEDLRQAMKGHTTPIRVMSLPPLPLEEPQHAMYVQSPKPGADPSPPPAVTIPMDRVAAKDRLFDEKLGAEESSMFQSNGSNGSAAQNTPRRLAEISPAPTTPKPQFDFR